MIIIQAILILIAPNILIKLQQDLNICFIYHQFEIANINYHFLVYHNPKIKNKK
jgi:hypothetical protein